MNKLIKSIAILSISIAILIVAINFKEKETNSDIYYQKAFENNYKIFSPTLPQSIDFCGEAVPLDIFYVREAVERELITNVFWQSNIMLFLKRSYRFFPIIEPILKQEGLPDDFKYLALIESSLTNVVSPAGASGFWQFMKATALRYNLEISDEVDERYNLEKSTFAACKYLKSSFNIFNNWTSAAASYNMGETGLKNQMTKQKENNYWNLLLSSETERYVPRIIAAKIILETPTKFGIYLRIKDLYQPIPTKEIVVDSSITNLADFAISNKINYKILKYFNPWLRDNKLTNSKKKKYNIKIPLEGYTSHSKLLSELKNEFEIYRDTIKLSDK